MKAFFVFLSAIFLSGCSDLFFYPAIGTLATPEYVGLKYENLSLKSENGARLHAWLVKSEGVSKGTVVFFHGNAENITTHTFGVMFLCRAGYDVLAVDYQGYGDSEGDPSFDKMAQDIRAATDYALDTLTYPVFVLGQSLGASMTAVALADYARQNEIAGIVFDSGFSKMRRIAREKIASVWLLWPFQYPLSFLVSEKNPEKAVAKIAVPKLFLASETDDVVPFSHTRRLYAAALEPKKMLITKTGAHIMTLHTTEGRAALLKFLDENKKLKNQRVKK